MHTRHDATRAIASIAQPSLVRASNAYAKFSDADTTASVAFLTGDRDLVYGRNRYISDLSIATDELAAISQTAGSTGQVEGSVRVINQELPNYTALVEAARSNNRQGFPVGAAYLRQASDKMRSAILPAVLSIYREEAGKLRAAYQSGASQSGPLFLLVITTALIALMVGVQCWLARRTRRILNLGWLAATVVAAVAATAVAVVIVSNSRDLESARQRGSDATAELSSARILAVRARADESLVLIARGSGTSFLTDFNEVAMRLRGNGRSGLAEQVRDTLRGLGSEGSADQLDSEYSAFFQEHQHILDLEDEGNYLKAINQTSNKEQPHLFRIVAILDTEIAASQQRFTAATKNAAFYAPGMYFVVTLGAVLVCALISGGIYPRLREYR